MPTRRMRRKTTAEMEKRSNMPTFLRPANLQIQGRRRPSLSLCILYGLVRVVVVVAVVVVWIDKTTPLIFSKEPLLLDRTPNPVISSPLPPLITPSNLPNQKLNFRIQEFKLGCSSSPKSSPDCNLIYGIELEQNRFRRIFRWNGKRIGEEGIEKLGFVIGVLIPHKIQK